MQNFTHTTAQHSNTIVTVCFFTFVLVFIACCYLVVINATVINVL